jgi:hypothetical protein
MKTFFNKIKIIIFVFFFSLLINPCFSKEDDGKPFKKLPGKADWEDIYNLINGIIHDSKSNWAPSVLFPPKVKENSSYGNAWKQSVNYFPDRYIYINNNKELMMHGPYNGKNCIEIYNSDFLKKSLSNEKIFGKNVVKEYNKISGDADKKKEINEKLGLLSGYFENEKSLEKLKKYLKSEAEKKGKTSKLYDDMMSALANEGKHMLTGALLHEGTHATLTDTQTANIQQDFANGYLSMELNELRAFMVEILYHCQYYNWAKNDISTQWGDIATLLADLENCRRSKPPNITQEEKEKIEEIKAKIKAHIAIIRVRLREIKDSAKRMKDLVDIYQKKYIKNIDPKKDKIKPESGLRENFRDLVISVTNFNIQVGQLAADMEKALKELEEILKAWNIYAECKIDFPPPPGPTDSLVTANRTKPFPEAPVKTAEEIKKKAEEEIGRNYSFIGEGSIALPTKNFSSISVSGGFGYSGVSMSTLNDYLDNINKNWIGNIEPISVGFGINFNINYYLTKNIAIGLVYDQMSTSTEGVLKTYNTSYKSENNTNGFLGQLKIKSNPIIGKLTLAGSVEAGPYFAHYNEAEEDFITEGNGDAFGFRITAAAEYMILPKFGVQAQTGYRSLNIGNFDASFFLPGNPSVKLDYSGFFGEIKATFYF